MQVLAFVILLWFQPIQLPEWLNGVSQHIDTEDGLSNNIVYDIYQDREGFIWLATENGLNRFDGYEFKKFYHSRDDSTSLSSNIVRSVLEDEEGNLWIGTFNGLNLYDRKSESFQRFIDLPDASDNRLDLKQLEFSEDSKLWFNTLEAVGWFDIKSHEFRFINSEPDPFSLTISNGNSVFIQSKKGDLLEYMNGDQKLRLIHSNPQHIQIPVYWGVYTNKLWGKGLISGYNIPDLPDNIRPTILMEINTDLLLIASDAGLFCYSKANESLTQIDFGTKSSTLTNSIRSLYQDRNGGVWVGTLNGVFHFDPYQKPFEHIDIIEGSVDVIMGLKADGNKVMINAFSQKLSVYNTLYNFTEEVKFPKDLSGEVLQIWDIELVEESEYPFWLATNSGLFLFNKKIKELKQVLLNEAVETAPASFSIYPDGDYIWVSSVFALYQLDKKSGTILKVIKPSGNTLSSIIQDIHKAGDTIYVATEGDGVLIHRKGTEILEPLENFINEASLLQTVPVWDLYGSNDNLVWIGTNQGLYRLDALSSEFTFVSAGTILENTVIFSIHEDDEANLWLGTEKGLVKFDLNTNEAIQYTKSDGVQNIEFNRKSSASTSDGRLWFGGVEGITVFDPTQIQTNTIVPPVHITNAEIITPDSVFSPSGLYQKELNLPWNQNTLEIRFTALNYTNSSQNKYRYKLEGYDPAWVEGGIERTARYVQLPHGEYTFKVLASNNDSIWNTEGASLQISISPPFWKTWWFRTLVAGIFLVMLWVVYRYRVRQLLEIERVKLRIAGDLHDEIGSGLSGIALTGDILSKQIHNGGAKPELIDRITQSSRSLASSLDTIVWLIDPKKETLGDLISKCQITAQDLLSDKNVKVDNSINEKEEGQVLSSGDRRNLFLFFKEAIHNIAKHSNANEVEISFCKKDVNLIIDICDNGIGFNMQEAGMGRGIGTMNQRAKELKSQLILDSSKSAGTHIRLTTKIP